MLISYTSKMVVTLDRPDHLTTCTDNACASSSHSSHTSLHIHHPCSLCTISSVILQKPLITSFSSSAKITMHVIHKPKCRNYLFSAQYTNFIPSKILQHFIDIFYSEESNGDSTQPCLRLVMPSSESLMSYILPHRVLLRNPQTFPFFPMRSRHLPQLTAVHCNTGYIQIS